MATLHALADALGPLGALTGGLLGDRLGIRPAPWTLAVASAVAARDHAGHTTRPHARRSKDCGSSPHAA
ncbi:hypothetical protein [Streptomyces rubellomurinus]|uniref:Uncharacterized protein n=1 Tax=Streptomyces sp. Y1 TaxID=3238634 RepID=A0AB39TBB4_9ACTN|nr:hypothetical protein VM98_24690 [Streptomyces rubellomurinus subsp. indigoferus]